MNNQKAIRREGNPPQNKTNPKPQKTIRICIKRSLFDTFSAFAGAVFAQTTYDKDLTILSRTTIGQDTPCYTTTYETNLKINNPISRNSDMLVNVRGENTLNVNDANYEQFCC